MINAAHYTFKIPNPNTESQYGQITCYMIPYAVLLWSIILYNIIGWLGSFIILLLSGDMENLIFNSLLTIVKLFFGVIGYIVFGVINVVNWHLNPHQIIEQQKALKFTLDFWWFGPLFTAYCLLTLIWYIPGLLLHLCEYIVKSL
jgi:hypothetical protein